MPKVTFITETLRQYRKKFHELLRQELHSAGIDYQLIYGQASSLEKAKKDEIDLSWGIKIANRYWHFGGIKFCWQPCLYLLKDSDLVIVTQANKLLLNYILMLQRYSGRSKLAFWGHGKNFQVEDTGSLREKFKRLYINQVDWWFAYNDLSAEIIKNAGVSSTKITIVQNAIDTKELIEYKNKLGNYDRVNLRCELGLLDCPIGIFCGGMYKEKRLGFLLEAAELIRNRIKNFQMVFIGEGPDSYLVKEAAHQKPWFRMSRAKK